MQWHIYRAPHELSSPRVAEALHTATRWPITDSDCYLGGGWIGFGSPYNWQALQECIKQNMPFVYIDKGYFMREHFYRITVNSFYPPAYKASNGTRLQTFNITIKPWLMNTSRSHIIACPQSDFHFEKNGLHKADWFNQVREAVRHTKYRLIIKEKRTAKPLSYYLKSAKLVISYNSNACLEAVLAGIPAICTGKSHIDCLVGRDLSYVTKPFYPENRLEYAQFLADNQWTLSEIASGAANEVIYGAW